MIPVNEFDRIIVDDVNKVFLFPVIDTVQINWGFLLSGLFPADQNNSGCCNPLILLKSTPKKVQNQMEHLEQVTAGDELILLIWCAYYRFGVEDGLSVAI